MAALLVLTVVTTRTDESAAPSTTSQVRNEAHGGSGDFPRTVETSVGDVVVAARPVRIVSCVPSADEMLVELVDVTRLWAVTHNAAVSRWSFAREALLDIPATRHVRFVAEQSDEIVRWQPDLVVVGSFTEAGFRERMRDAGIPVLTLQAPDSLEAIFRNLELLGRATGEDEAATALRKRLRERLAAVRERVAGDRRLRALYLAYYGEELSTVGEGSTLDVQLEHAGYANLGRRKLAGSWGPLGFEHVADLDRTAGIEVLLFPHAERANDTRDPTVIPHAARFASLPGADQLTPIARDPSRLLEIPQRYVQTSSHHIVSGIEWLAAQRKRLAQDAGE